jgi:protein-S-isoprenylcysteine O-methyltransferase Ste14
MAKMTPQQEGEYALRSGVARRHLSKDAQAVYDRVVDQRARAEPPPAVSQTDAEDTSHRVAMPKWAAAVGTALLFLIGQGFVAVLLPWSITHWRAGRPYPFAVRAVGVVLVVVGGIVVVAAFVRFATEGIGMPLPFEPTSRELIAGGPYRYLRNPMYLASVTTVIAQALLLSRAEVLIYAAALLAAAVAFVHGSRNRRWPGALVLSTRTTASRCLAGGRGCHAEHRMGFRVLRIEGPRDVHELLARHQRRVEAGDGLTGVDHEGRGAIRLVTLCAVTSSCWREP